MYRGRLWTMRQYAGFGTAAETNRRFHHLLGAGQTGLSVAFDLPTQMGIDSDSPRALGEVGRVGVAIDSVEDMRRAVVYGSAMGSFAVERFSIERLLEIGTPEIRERLTAFRRLVAFEEDLPD